MNTKLVACEYEDSQNCIWNAQEQGNGVGQTFVDIDGTAYYVEDPTVYEDVWVDGQESFTYQYVIAQVNGEDYMVIIWEGETVIAEPAELEAVEVVPVAPEAIETGVTELAETGTAEVITGALVGIALMFAGVVTLLKGREVS